MATDFRFGVPLTYGEGPWRTKFGFYHLSSHVGDEYLLKNPTSMVTQPESPAPSAQ